MNDLFKSKCDKPEFFSSIRYLVQSLPKKEMQNLIIDISGVNAYLAIQCYLSSESDRVFWEELKESIAAEYLSFLNKNYSNGAQLAKHISFVLAFYYIDSKNYSMSLCYWVVNNMYYQPFWVSVDDTWRGLLTETLNEMGLYDLNNFFLSFTGTNVTSTSMSLDDKKTRELIECYQSKKYYRVLEIIDLFGLYGHLNKYGIDIFEMIRPKSYPFYGKRQNDGTATFFLSQYKKMVAIWICTKNDEIKRNEIIMEAETARVQNTKLFSIYKKTCAQYDRLLTSGEMSLASRKQFKYWDKDRNGIVFPYRFYCFKTSICWFKCDNGHSWRQNCPNGHTRYIKCPTCNTNKGITEYSTISSKKNKIILVCFSIITLKERYLYLAYGLTDEGRCHILNIMLVDENSANNWEKFVSVIKEEKLEGLLFIIIADIIDDDFANIIWNSFRDAMVTRLFSSFFLRNTNTLKKGTDAYRRLLKCKNIKEINSIMNQLSSTDSLRNFLEEHTDYMMGLSFWNRNGNVVMEIEMGRISKCGESVPTTNISTYLDLSQYLITVSRIITKPRRTNKSAYLKLVKYYDGEYK